MPSRADRPQSQRYLVGAASALVAAGCGLTLLTFYPGIMTFDAKYVYADIAKGTYGDWQSPVMTWLWGVIDPIAPGAASMFLLAALLYWLGFGVLSFVLARRGKRSALLLPILALTPPALAFVGIIWRDVLLAGCWLLAAGIVFAVCEKPSPGRRPVQWLAFALIVLGVLLRPNALLAAPILIAYIVWPHRMWLRRTAILYIPAAIGLFAVVQLVYYGALGATRQHPLQSIMVFDLGGISHFAKENQYPVTWSAAETTQLLNTCYDASQWDVYWRLAPCDFVMRKIEREEGLFGTSAIPKAWLRAIGRHPIAYLAHRSAYFWNFLTASNLTMWLADIERPDQTVFPDRGAFRALVSMHDWLKPTPAFRLGAWLLLCVAVCGLVWRRRDTCQGAFALGLCGSAAIYVLSFFFVGVAPDFRYGYWAVVAGIAGAVVAASSRRSADSLEG